MVFAALLSTLLAAPSAEPPVGPAMQAPPIVVTGRRIEDGEEALRACLARKCLPEEDIAATLRMLNRCSWPAIMRRREGR